MGANGPINLCLLVEDGVATLVDAGIPGTSETLLSYLDEIQLAPQAVRRVIITHHHVDHVGGLPEIVKLTRAEVWAHSEDAPVIDGRVPRDEIPPERLEAMLAHLAPEQRAAALERMKQMMGVPGVRIDLSLVGGEELCVLGGVQILHTPGHTPGHLALFLPALSLLIAGDLMRYDGDSISASRHGSASDPSEALASARRAAALEFDAFVGYHGGYVAAGAKELVCESLRTATR
jgi:glyoxylase-like metal-dependent hydrolase (beta-lactamase superfamily II)